MTSADPAQTAAPVQPGDLPRVLGVSHATAIVVGTIIGSGIFLVPQEMMRAVGSSSMVYLAWIVGGLLSLFGAMTYAELGAMMPATGGEYVYLRGAYGDLPAFLYMWTWFSVAKPASIASVTTGLARVLAIFPALAWLDGVALHGRWEITWSQVFAIAATWLITGLNYLGIRKAGDFQLFFTWLKGALILVIAGFCFASAKGSVLNFHTFFPGAHGGFGGFMIALIAALWAYDGWNDLTMVAGEVRRPERSLPIALIFGLFIVGVLYMATNAAIQYILPAAQIAASPRPAVTAMALVTGGWGAGLVSVAMATSILVTLNGTIMSGARIPFAAARDKLFFAKMATIHPRFQSPSFVDRSGIARDAAATRRRTLPATLRVSHLRRMALLHGHGNHRLRLSKETPQRNSPLPSLGIPSPPRALRRRSRNFALLLLRRKLEEFADWDGDYFAGDSVVWMDKGQT